ncbi:hypothetical protein GCM10023205_03840 [Yinghuangia aomiensis]|uniref:NACHT domain-containing protein n=1 Tax=Yinghuangia aomiensis TaxID=676205 RepID=A0ABP9GLC7_9ACTN
MPDYDLTRLGPRAFEQLTVALARCELGPGVEAFGDGRDGGREATFDGTIDWSKTANPGAGHPDSWSGYTVLQAKFQVKPKAQPHDNAVWFQNEVGKEIASWRRAARADTRTRLPDYLIFVTNVDLSPVARTGGLDTVTAFVQKQLSDGETHRDGLHVRGFRIWHADQIRSMLDAHQGVRWAYPGLLTVGDVLSMLGRDVVSMGSLEVRDPVREELLQALKADRWIRLSQSGGPGDAKLWLDDVAIDLPATADEPEATTVQTVRHILDLGDIVLRRRQPGREVRSNVVLVGGPGQGKSTLSQLIAQAYRVAMLTDADLASSTAEIVGGTRAALGRLGLRVPGNRRWPVRIDLAKYAEELATGSETGLLRWISTQVSKRTTVPVPPKDLHGWLRSWPWALILDGLDEVPSLEARRLVYAKLDELLTTAEDIDADLMVVVTTRPTGYDERFPSDRFQHLNLQRLPPAAAASFARRITAKRFVDDDDMRILVAERMTEASRDPVTVRLMETPLQVTIMSLIVEKYPTLPPDRYSLFNLYYETMCEREIAKGIALSRFISTHRKQVNRLHEQVGLALQVASETAKNAEAVLSPDELNELAVDRFASSGFDPEDAQTHATTLVNAATERLVLLVPRDAGIGFDIRTLQELMAARSITEGDDSQVLERLRLVAHHPHWRNTFLLAVGHLQVVSDRFENHLLNLLTTLDVDPRRLGPRFPSAPALAADILEDNLAAHRPAFERGLVHVVCSALDHPPVVDLSRLAAALLRISSTGHRRTTFDRIASAVTAGASRRAAAALLLHEMRRGTRDNGPLTSIRIALENLKLSTAEVAAVDAWEQLRRDVLPLPGALVGSERDVASYLNLLVGTLDLGPDDAVALVEGLAVLAGVHYRLDGPPPETAVVTRYMANVNPEPLLQALDSYETARALAFALDTVPASHWAIESALGYVLVPARNRQAVGGELRRVVAEARASTLGPPW